MAKELTKEEKAEIIAYAEKYPNASINQIARNFGRGWGTVRDCVEEYKLKQIVDVVAGEMGSRPKYELLGLALICLADFLIFGSMNRIRELIENEYNPG